MRIHLKTLGCRLNEAELESWASQFQSKGHVLTRSLSDADLLIINTCAVTHEAVKKSRQLIRKTQRINPNAKLVVSGCYVSFDRDLPDDIDGIDLIIHNRDKDRLVEIVLAQLNAEIMPATAIEPGASSLFQRGRNRAFIKIQDGCRYRCTFCLVTQARGLERSRPAVDIVHEINQYHQHGVQEVVLTGVHLGGYGSDINLDIYQLIKIILQDTDIPRIRLASIEPWDLPEDLFTLFNTGRLMPHMHLPLQSGDDATLKKMARRCKTNTFRQLVQQAQQQIKNLNITTDIIVGFPGETERAWQNTLHFIEEMQFSHIHIFTYSKRSGTTAARLPDQIPIAIKKERSKELHNITRALRERFYQSQAGQSYQVLWETKNQQGRWTGYTDNYIKVELKKTPGYHLGNTISNVKITGISKQAEYCQTILQTSFGA